MICPYAGRFRGASHPSHYADLIEQAEALAKVVDFPAIAVSRQDQFQEVGSNAYYGGVVYPTDGTLQPAKLHRGLCQIAQQAGVLMLEHTMVRGVTKQGNYQQVQYDGGMIKRRSSDYRHEWLHGKRIWQIQTSCHSYSLRDDRNRRTA